MREWWLKFRNQLLTSANFQRWAATFILTKPIANRKARALFNICAGFVNSQVLYACIQLKVFEFLQAGPRSLSEIAQQIDLSEQATRQLLIAANTLKLTQQSAGEKYCLGELGAAMLGNPGIEAMVSHHKHFYADLHDPVNLLRGKAGKTNLSQYWGYAESSDPNNLLTNQVSEYTQLMAESVQLLAQDVLQSYSFEKHKSWLDVGGGSGAFLVTVCKRWPQLQAKLVDLPAVIDIAKANVQKQSLDNNISFHGKDIFNEALPADNDVISLVRILHDHNDPEVKILLKQIYRALKPNGELIVAEPMSNTPGMEMVSNAYFNFYLLAMGSGRPRSPDEIIHLLKEAGFTHCRQINMPRPLISQLIVARKG